MGLPASISKTVDPLCMLIASIIHPMVFASVLTSDAGISARSPIIGSIAVAYLLVRR